MAFTGAQFYSVMVGVVPLYVAILLGYGSLRWWKLVQEPQQCVGIAQLNTYFLIPVYVFHVLAFNDPYTLSLRILAADFLSKAVPLCMLCVWAVVPSSLYSSTKQEEVAARRRKFDWAISFFMLATLPNTVIVEIPLLQPMYGKIAIQGSICIISAQCLFWYNVCIVLFEVRAAQLQITEDMQLMIKANNNKRELILAQRQKMHIMSAAARGGGAAVASHAVVYPDEEENDLEEAHVDHDTSFRSLDIVVETVSNHNLLAAQDHELLKRHENIMNFSRGNNNSCATTTSDAAGNSCSSPTESEIEAAGAAAAFATKVEELDQLPGLLPNKKEMVVHDLSCKQTLIKQQLGRLSMLQQVCKRVLFRLLRLPILYGSVLGFTYSLLASRWGFNMPQIVEASLQIFTNMTLGTSMFVLGLFMANQPHLLPCGLWKTIEGIVIRFGVGPAIMTIASVAVGIRGNSLRFVITQAAVPQGIITFILANEYNMHADIFATAVSFQMLIFLPFVLLYYILLGLL
ncbi:unnamed protein product [Sphagnum jensenii]|uniref:Auxin efflux carrier component n=1 Tax=Sphagnum jensenii TaxID=128206 RepID=A0ABP0VNP5_9BRYO